MDSESILTLGRCNSVAAVSFGTVFERALAFLFPPELKPLDAEEMDSVLEYQQRISRRGVERNPAVYAGVQIVSVTEAFVPPLPQRGTAASRAANHG